VQWRIQTSKGVEAAFLLVIFINYFISDIFYLLASEFFFNKAPFPV